VHGWALFRMHGWHGIRGMVAAAIEASCLICYCILS
jgi:hypothetical protein